MKYWILFWLVGLVIFPKVVFAADAFSWLEKVEIGEVLNEAMKFAGTYQETSEVRGYEFESSLATHPHQVYVAENGLITYVQLTIPPELQAEYTARLEAFGSPEEELAKARSEIVYAYPSKGLTFIVNAYTGQVERVQKFPDKNVEQFIEREGRNFEVVVTDGSEVAAAPGVDMGGLVKGIGLILLSMSLFLLLIWWLVGHKQVNSRIKKNSQKSAH